MFRILGNPRRACDGRRAANLLVAGGLGALGSPAARPPADRGRAKSVICLFLFGGWSQFETFDPKPDAPPRSAARTRPIATLRARPARVRTPAAPGPADAPVAVVRSSPATTPTTTRSLILTGHHATVGGTAVKGINPGIPRLAVLHVRAAALPRARPARRPRRCPNTCACPTAWACWKATTGTGPYGGFLGPALRPRLHALRQERRAALPARRRQRRS